MHVSLTHIVVLVAWQRSGHLASRVLGQVGEVPAPEVISATALEVRSQMGRVVDDLRRHHELTKYRPSLG